jgi:hypothetical protein
MLDLLHWTGWKPVLRMTPRGPRHTIASPARAFSASSDERGLPW